MATTIDTEYLAKESSSDSPICISQPFSNPRLTRWQLQQEAQKLLPDERVAFCMRRTQSTTVDVLYSPKHQSAHYSGLMVCGSVWVCPICAAKISEQRRVELEQAIVACISKGGSVYLATYTIAHKRYDNLSNLLQSFLAARKRARQGRTAQELRKAFGVLGTISVREVTWSELNGWHPHSHELVFFATEVDAQAYETATREQLHAVLNNNARGELLEVARKGDWQKVKVFLRNICAKYCDDSV